jgi:peptidoglycan/xylan/chitin deacetylase (PgdA/CDA1 family)
MVIEEAGASSGTPLELLKGEGTPTQNDSRTGSQAFPSLSQDAPDSTGKTLYLTFDDGPVEGTGNVLDVLEEEGVEATMFCVGRHAQKRRKLFFRERRMSQLLVANHTYSHANGHYSRFYRNLWGVMSDVEHAQLLLGGRKYLRLAGRNVWRIPEVRRDDRAIPAHRRQVEVPKYERLAKEGFYIYGWDVEWRFDHATGRPIGSAHQLANTIESIQRHHRSAQRDKVVLLAHDFMFRDATSTEELRRFIRIMKERGWQFKKIDHYAATRPEPLYVAKYYGKKVQHLAANDPVTSQAAEADDPRKKVAVVSSMRPAKATRPKTATPRHLSRSETTGRSLQARLNDAIRRYDSQRVEALVREGARINQRDEYGRLALNTAIRANSIHLVKMLLAMGADLRTKDGKGNSALRIARDYKRQAIEKYLIEYSLKRGVQKVAINARPHRLNPLAMLRP